MVFCFGPHFSLPRPPSRCYLAAFICKWTGNCVGKQLGIPHHKGAREMEAGRSEKKQTGSDKVTRQKKWADAHHRAKTVCGESGLEDEASESRCAGLVLLQHCTGAATAAIFWHLFSSTIKYTQVRRHNKKKKTQCQISHLSFTVNERAPEDTECNVSKCANNPSDLKHNE